MAIGEEPQAILRDACSDARDSAAFGAKYRFGGLCIRIEQGEVIVELYGPGKTDEAANAWWELCAAHAEPGTLQNDSTLWVYRYMFTPKP